MNFKASCLHAVWLAIAVPLAVLAEVNVNPGINRSYQDADVNRWRSVFERDGREVWDRRRDIVAALGLRPGMRIADIGAGTGFFSFMFADAVGPSGHVYAVDVTPEFVADIRTRAQGLGLRQVTAVHSGQRDIGLNAASVDTVFVCDTYHHFEYPQTMLRAIHRALRPGGDLVVVDYRRVVGFSSPWVMRHVRAGEDQVRDEVERAGFRLVERQDFMQTQYWLRFRRQDGAAQ